MIPDEEYQKIIAENELRREKLAANYDPITGKGLDKYLEEKRVLLEIPDFAIPEQWVPESMMRNPMIKGIVKAGSIQKYIDTRKWKSRTPEFLDIERQIRRIRHKHDFCFWAYFCIRIVAKLGGRIRFKLNLPQLLVLAELEKMRLAGVPIDIIILKARQWGGSTLCIFYQAWIAFKWDEYHSFAVAAHIQTASETILTMLKDAIATYPAWDLGLPADTRLTLGLRGKTNNAYLIKTDKGEKVLETVIYIGTAERPETLRSSNAHGAHYSEVGLWPDTPEKRPSALIADISGGITKRALDMQVMESTAKSSDDFFHDMWTAAMKGESSYRPIFIPWFYIPHDTMEIRDVRAFVEWLYEHRNDEQPNGKWKDSGKHYWWLWTLGASLEGINWYRYKRRDLPTYIEMANEAPSTWMEAFQSAGLKVFDFYEVEEKRMKCKPPVVCGDLYSAAREGEDVLKDITFKPRRDGLLKIWEMPDDSPIENRYLVAVDIGGPNSTSDWSSVRVLDRYMMMPQFGLDGRPNIVAEMHYHTQHDLLAYDAMRLAAWYNNALLVIESNTVEMENRESETGGDGSEYILDIVGEIYPNLYQRRGKSEDVKESVQPRWGFKTDRFTKPKIIDFMKTCLREDKWYEPSEICCEEMSQYIQVQNKFTAPPKKHDDVLMATAILLWICYREMDLPEWIRRSGGDGRPKIRGRNSGLVNL